MPLGTGKRRRRKRRKKSISPGSPRWAISKSPVLAQNDTDNNAFMWPPGYQIGGGAASNNNKINTNDRNDSNDNDGNFTPIISSDDSNTEQEIIGVVPQWNDFVTGDDDDNNNSNDR